MDKRPMLLLSLLLLMGCQSSPAKIIGLWEITNVNAGGETMTPNARWARFYADGRQESGNGWLKHSAGQYQYDQDESVIKMQTTEGLDDEFGQFSIAFTSKDQMQWSRTEGGQTITVNLNRIDQLPKGFTDQARGLWKLTSATGQSELIAADINAHLFLRWDGRYFDYQSSKAGGVYNIHGHKPEIEFIPYDPQLERSWWRFTQTNDTLVIQLLNTEEEVKRTYVKTKSFPDN